MARISTLAAIKLGWDLSWKLNLNFDEVLGLIWKMKEKTKPHIFLALKLFYETSKSVIFTFFQGIVATRLLEVWTVPIHHEGQYLKACMEVVMVCATFQFSSSVTLKCVPQKTA